jgi:hypothetical protein
MEMGLRQNESLFYLRDRWTCLKLDVGKFIMDTVDTLRLDENILNCIYHQTDNHSRLAWAVVDYQQCQ